jgi:CDP-2,3-bis-(O-geranylgeranyl)-sn-glycerol synthase
MHATFADGGKGLSLARRIRAVKSAPRRVRPVTLVETVAVAIWAMLPAYVPNNAAVLLGGGRPIDGGRTLDGARVLGDGKTWRGAVAGTLAGVALALVLNAIASATGTATGLALPTFPPAAVLALPLGAICGDMLASFLKRRTGRSRGTAFPGLDQLDFLLGALALTALAATAWFTATFTPGVLATVLVLTPLLHVTANIAAYRAGLKSEPW